MEFWIQQERRPPPQQWNGYGSWGDGWSPGAQAYAPQEPYGRAPVPHVTVKAPQYHTYTPDVPKLMALEKVCQFQLASNAVASPLPATPSFASACAVTPTLSMRALPEVAAAINDYYSSHPHFVWIDHGVVSDKARAAVAALALSGRVGLSPADYRVNLPKTTDSSIDDPANLQAIMHFELALSAKVLTYVLDATRGRIDPNRMSAYYDLPRKKVDLVAALGDIAKAEDVVGYLDSRNPDNAQFRALTATLAKLRAAAPKRAMTIPDNTSIRPGETSAALPQVIAAVRRAGSEQLKKAHADTLAAYQGSDVYGAELVALIRDFQREKSLSADGVVGPNTIKAMRQDTPAAKIKKVTLAMERLRWLPRRFGNRYVFLNEAAFQVTYRNGDAKPLTMRAIVGKPSRQTFFFTDKIESVEYNPYWNVPRSIVVNEMLPHLYRDPYYLDRHGYQVTDARGQQISSAAVNWSAVARKQASVDVKQPPGPRNALGLVKIEFPNKHAIYMHDTPEKHLFEHKRLAFSHGCVRLRHPREMAAALLGKPVSYIDDKISNGQNTSEKVAGDIPVYLTYFTAWPGTDGTVRYYGDVYGRDGHLSDALAKTEAARKNG